MINSNFFKNKNILITGGTGLIGCYLTNHLTDLGAKVVSASIDSEERVMQVLNNPKLFKFVDFRNYEDCKNITKDKDIVINLMGIRESTQLGVKKSASAMSNFLICNTNIVSSSFDNSVGMYSFCGSINEYPPLKIRHEEQMWDGLPSANDRYVGVAKRVGEMQAEAYSIQYNSDIVKIIRPSNVYGPFDNFDPLTAHVIPSLIYKILNSTNNELIVAGDGSAIRDFIFIEDLIDGILLTLEKGRTNFPFNIGSGYGVTIKELVETIKQIVNPNIKIIWDSKLNSGDDIRVLDISRAKKHLAFNPKTSIESGLKSTLEWYLKNKDLAYKLGRTYE